MSGTIHFDVCQRGCIGWRMACGITASFGRDDLLVLEATTAATRHVGHPVPKLGNVQNFGMNWRGGDHESPEPPLSVTAVNLLKARTFRRGIA